MVQLDASLAFSFVWLGKNLYTTLEPYCYLHHTASLPGQSFEDIGSYGCVNVVVTS